MSSKTESKLADSILDGPFLFWECPKGCRGIIKWDLKGMQATCTVCGEKSSASDPDPLKHAPSMCQIEDISSEPPEYSRGGDLEC